ncbi:MAG: hypothetical protein A2033_07860 [Bacteroidetes bacterium GWA2_31_9]|nr:MAG: hypothetical protein A2033_07860 [Bacteroidetes bacterium GWA2_31_9]
MYQLNQFGNIPFTHGALKLLLSNYKSINDKISKLIYDGEIVSLKKGLYVVSEKYRTQKISKEILANIIYGPSYISMDSALSFYGIIPEKTTTTVSIIPKRAKKFVTLFGDFNYIQAPIEYYSIGITQENINNQYHFLMATPEKALCDKLLFTKNLNLNSLKSMQSFLFDDLRADFQHIEQIDFSIIEKCIKIGYKHKELEFLLKILKTL